MKKIAILILGGILSFSSGCEKDDICDSSTPTTPHLVIDFYDVNNPTTLKNIAALQVVGDGGNGVLSFDGVSQIKLPLKTMADLTQYHFTINADNNDLKNQDDLEFDYARKDEYISRACGYKTLFTLSGSPILTDPTADTPWIQNIEVVTPNINNENETHLKIYF